MILNCPDEFGLTNGKLYLQFPEHMLAKNGGFYSTKQGCLVDLCIAKEIVELWNKGISTFGSCCGHGRVEGAVSVDIEDVDKMIKLGYKLFEGREDAFILKSKHRKKHKLK